ncbi:MAG: hypothetical protein NWE94_03215 [Candidatus Bathyarchaeota archaeon]|nr:hypothetical protein [Candidatus Bathyarchaeota archaeon]
MKIKNIVALVVCIASFALIVNMAYAASATWATISVEDSSGKQKVEFDVGETVYLKWTANGDVDIVVTYYETEDDPTGDPTSFNWYNQPSSGTVSFEPDAVGFYEVSCTGATKKRLLAYGTFFVIPESILGTLMATAACFAAFGAFRYNRSKKLHGHN